MLTHIYTHTLTHKSPVTQFHPHTHTHPLTHLFTHPLTHLLTHASTHTQTPKHLVAHSLTLTLGMGKSLKPDSSLLVFMKVERFTHETPSCTFSVKCHSPPTSSARSKPTTSSPASRQVFTDVSPLAPAPTTATLFTTAILAKQS